ncbi:MAG: hypothetical protein QF531_02550 [Candidatus Poseidonia sp.]|jgi:hypothetical protein|nr:hypothetical protein [Poseidonia sp.]
MAQESLAPVAAITNLILGIITITMSNRDDSKNTHKRFSALLIGWTFIFLAIYHSVESIFDQYYGPVWVTAIDLGLYTYRDITGADLLALTLMGADSALNVLMLIMALHIPKDIGQGKAWNATILAIIALYCIIVPPMTFIGGIKMMALQEFVWVTVGVIWIHTYIRGIVLEHTTNDERHRSLSKASAILLVIWLGWQMVWWLSAFTFLNNEWFVSVLSNQPENPPLWWLISVNFGWSIGAIAISVLFIGEVFRSVNRGTSAESWIVFAIFFIGFMNWIQDYLLLDAYYSCIEGNCDEGSSEIFDLINYLTSGVLIYLIKPLFLVYLMVRFKIINISSEENRNLMRIMILLILLIISSSIIELIQSLVPIPQMVSGTILAIGVVFFIGWEEKITSSFLSGGNEDDIQAITGDGFTDSMLRNTSVLFTFIAVYIFVVAVIFANAGV